MKKPREKKPRRRRRRPRLKKRRGPVQLWLPLQMPLALGPLVFAPAPEAAPAVDAPAAPAAPAGEQRPLF